MGCNRGMEQWGVREEWMRVRKGGNMEVNRMLPFWQMLQKAEFTDNWKSFIGMWNMLSLRQQLRLQSLHLLFFHQPSQSRQTLNEPSSAKDRETSYSIQMMQNSKCTTECSL